MAATNAGLPMVFITLVRFIGEHVQRHFGGDVGKPFHEKVRGAHPRLDRAEGVFDRLAAGGHGARIGVEPALNLLDQVLVLSRCI